MLGVILCGGGGSRLWPLSRKSLPKQYQKIVGDKTLLEMAYERLRLKLPDEKIFVLAIPAYEKVIRDQLPNIPSENFIFDPAKRDTGPAQGYAALKLIDKYPDEPMVFCPSDHVFGDNKEFAKLLDVIEKTILEEGKMVDVGIKPTYPNTNLGYTHVGDVHNEINGVKIRKFKGHREKPNLETARDFIQGGNHLWHVNYYSWTPRKFLEAFQKYAPELHEPLMKIRDASNPAEEKAIYESIEPIALDYALAERMDPEDALIVMGELEWSDVGDWGFLHEMLTGDSKANSVEGKHIGIETTGSLIKDTEGKKLIGTVGLEDCVIVNTPDSLLVCKKDKARDVKKLVEELEKDEERKKFVD